MWNVTVWTFNTTSTWEYISSMSTNMTVRSEWMMLTCHWLTDWNQHVHSTDTSPHWLTDWNQDVHSGYMPTVSLTTWSTVPTLVWLTSLTFRIEPFLKDNSSSAVAWKSCSATASIRTEFIKQSDHTQKWFKCSPRTVGLHRKWQAKSGQPSHKLPAISLPNE